MALGTLLAGTMKPDERGSSGYAAASRNIPIIKYLFENGVYATRSLGNVVYMMVSSLTSKELCSKLCQIIHDAIEKLALDLNNNS